MPLILSLDGGSTSLKVGLIDSTSKSIVFKLVINSPFNYKLISDTNGEQGVQRILNQLPKENVNKIVIGISGADTKEELLECSDKINKIFQSQYSGASIEVFNDVDLVLQNTASNLKNKVAIISGTGSNCVGINEKGQRAKAGGLGYILSDQGSGYYIGLLALRSSIESEDGRAKPSKLQDTLFKRMSVTSGADLKRIVYNKDFAKKDFAKLALVVVELANIKDQTSIQILQQAGYELFKHVKAVANNLDLKDKEFVVIESGSMFKVKDVREPFEEMVKEYFPKVILELPKNPSFWGAVNL